jgi:Mce-associated membrane protein
VALSVVVALVAACVAGYLLLTRNQDAQRREDALAAARQYAVDLTTYDFSNVDADFQRFARHGTREFQKTYAATIAAARPAILQAQSRAIGTVVGAGLESYADGRASVLLAVDQAVRSAAKPGTQVDRNRIRITLLRAGDGWLVSAVKVF